MKHNLLRSVTYGVGLGVVTMGNHPLPVHAQVSSLGGSLTRLESIAAEVRTEGTAEPANAWVNRLTGDPALTQDAVNLPAGSSLPETTPLPSATVDSPTPSVSWSKGLTNNSATAQSSLNPTVADSPASSLKRISPEDAIATQPIPESLTSSAEALTLQPTQDAEIVLNESQTLAQTDLDIRRGTRGVPNYLGIGVNIGLTEDDDEATDDGGGTALGDAGFVINGKIGLSRTLSLRPGVIIGDDALFMVPLTYDFIIPRVDPFEPVRFAPFLGGGVALSTDSDDNIGFLLTGGVDVPLSRSFVANGSINIGFIEDETDIGIILGVGYTFPDF
ncbi:outer membrane insertion C-terminal signal domain protein [Coleofasciculus chthonoplastes PCC 7420]|uniref:Outer membrane insertion C-terminal signal domain protein n=1 Tax=Coleofasciculus chthonoplastes PCC 7420 TaxID=118168 RepID=B4VWC3_9CYAN|nr:hypothetical protein [Coleofasciculus chthonoplastes]EDX73636.1 outer membrane insertion C-terminal signal domain protein [Coleofasciculus chthonoplastes PCC 7420]